MPAGQAGVMPRFQQGSVKARLGREPLALRVRFHPGSLQACRCKGEVDVLPLCVPCRPCADCVSGPRGRSSRSQPCSQGAAASLQSSPLAPVLQSLSLRHGRAGIAKATLCFGSFASPAQPGAWLAPVCACFPPTAARNAGDAPRP